MKQLFAILLTSLLLCVAACAPKKEENEKSPKELAEKKVEAYLQAEERYQKELPNETYIALIKTLAKENEHIREFLEVYPNAYQVSSRMLERAGPISEVSDAGIPEDTFLFVADLYGRYRFRCFVPFYLNSDLNSIESSKEPFFDMYETVNIEKLSGVQNRIHTRAVKLPDGSQRFEIEHWIRLKESNFDWSTLGIELTTDQPVEGFGPENKI